MKAACYCYNVHVVAAAATDNHAFKHTNIARAHIHFMNEQKIWKMDCLLMELRQYSDDGLYTRARHMCVCVLF